MEVKNRILVTLLIGIFLVTAFYLITDAITKYTGYSVSEDKDKDFKDCLKKQDIVLYLNTNDIVISYDSIILKDYLEDFEIFNCMRNNQLCAGRGINSFPTWIINENQIERDISFEELVELSGCKPVEND
jgi:hypothetical protein